MYRQLRFGVNDSSYKLVPTNENLIKVCLKNPRKDIYTSIYKYNEKQFQEFQNTKTIQGVKDVITDCLVFDFDSKENPSLAQDDAKQICKRLLSYGITEDALRISFSGGKGFHVEVHLNEDITVDEFKAITLQLANGLKTFDDKINDHARPFRVLGSINVKTGLYKTPLSLDELQNCDIKTIKEFALKQTDVDPEHLWNNQWPSIDLPEELKKLKHFKEEYKPVVENIEVGSLDWAKRPKWLSNCRYSLQNGYFKDGERNTALCVLAATYKNQGFNIDHTYRFLKGVAECQARISGGERFPDDEIWNNVILEVYSDAWKGGQYSCKDIGTPLYNYCQSLGTHKCKHEKEEYFIEIDDFAGRFKEFAVNIDKNRLKFGIPAIDEKVMVTTSMLVGLLGAPSAGKTTLLVNFLEQSNKDKIDSVFFSMDMSLPLVYLRLIQRHFGYDKEQVFDIFLNDYKKTLEIMETIKEKYKYTKFSFRTGLSVEDMRKAIKEHEEKISRKVKLVGVDYLECISGPYSDATANSGLVANQLKDVSNDLEVCTMLLLQTQKQSGDPSDPLLSMRNVKGASVIEQACSVILSLSRPGFSPIKPEDDKFATISTVKDRMGSLMSTDCGWNGLKGLFYTLCEEDEQLLDTVRMRKAEAKKAEGNGFL